MIKTIKRSLMGLVAMAATFSLMPAEAKAYSNDYCREYTRTVYIGGRAEEAYGKACQQQNGDWMIVDEDLGANIPRSDNRVNYVIRDQTVYYGQPSRVNVYRTVPRSTVVWYNGGPRNNRYVKYNNNYRDDRNWHKHDRKNNGHGPRHDRGHDGRRN